MREKYSANVLAATLFGLGNAPVAPGTVATLAAGVPCFLAIGYLSPIFQILASAGLLAAGCMVSDKAERELEKTDPQQIVIDELCGFLIAMIAHPVTFPSILTGFALFRLFDIWKPWPLRLMQERLNGGLGVMMDDVGAGIYANILGLIILRLFGYW
ncbi:MAG: phosphatidylglycerophosphatase A [Syntrophobacteraceae bacterium]